MNVARPRVLIVDSRAVIGVEVCRILAAHGCETHVFAERTSPALFSRFCHRRLLSPSFYDTKAYCDALAEVVEATTYDAIHVCHEPIFDSILPMMGCRGWKALLIPPVEGLKIALSKSASLALATRTGVATPRTAIPEREAELKGLVREFGFPVVIKGDKGESGEKVRIARRANEVIEGYREILAGQNGHDAPPSVQEFIRGPAYSVGGLFINGRPLRVVAHRKLLRYPYPFGGMTVKGVTEDCAELKAEAFKIFEALEYTGLGHVEFIRDERDGRFKFLEINPRLWGTIGVAEWAGVDLFTPYRQLVKGMPVEPDLRYKDRVVFHRIRREVRLIRQRPLRLIGFVKDSLDPRVRSDFVWSDPRPHLPSRYQLRKLLWSRTWPLAPTLSLEKRS